MNSTFKFTVSLIIVRKSASAYEVEQSLMVLPVKKKSRRSHHHPALHHPLAPSPSLNLKLLSTTVTMSPYLNLVHMTQCSLASHLGSRDTTTVAQQLNFFQTRQKKCRSLTCNCVGELADVPLTASGAQNGSGASGEGKEDEEFHAKVCNPTHTHRLCTDCSHL